MSLRYRRERIYVLCRLKPISLTAALGFLFLPSHQKSIMKIYENETQSSIVCCWRVSLKQLGFLDYISLRRPRGWRHSPKASRRYIPESFLYINCFGWRERREKLTRVSTLAMLSTVGSGNPRKNWKFSLLSQEIGYISSSCSFARFCGEQHLAFFPLRYSPLYAQNRNLFITVKQKQHQKCIKQYVTRNKSAERKIRVLGIKIDSEIFHHICSSTMSGKCITINIPLSFSRMIREQGEEKSASSRR